MSGGRRRLACACVVAAAAAFLAASAGVARAHVLIRPRQRPGGGTAQHGREHEQARCHAHRPVDSNVVFCTTLTGREITRFHGAFGLGLAGRDLVAEPGQQAPQPLVEQILRTAVQASPHARRAGAR